YKRPVTVAILDRSGHLVVIGTGRKALGYEVRSGHLDWSLQHRGLVTSAAFSPDGGVLATGCADKTAQLWDPATGKRLHILPDNRGRVTHVAFSPLGRLLVTSSTGGA